MKPNLSDRPHPTIEMTQPYTSSVNVDRLLEKLREWEMWADSIGNQVQEEIDRLRREANKSENPIEMACIFGCAHKLEEILGVEK